MKARCGRSPTCSHRFGIESVSAGEARPAGAGGDRREFRRECEAQGAWPRRELRDCRPCRRFGAGGRGAWRRARHLFGALGRPDKEFRSRHGARAARAGGVAAPPTERAQFHLRAGAGRARRRRRSCSKARCSARSSGRRAGRAASAMIRSSCRRAMMRLSARWSPRLKACHLAPRAGLREIDAGSL